MASEWDGVIVKAGLAELEKIAPIIQKTFSDYQDCFIECRQDEDLEAVVCQIYLKPDPRNIALPVMDEVLKEEHIQAFTGWLHDEDIWLAWQLSKVTGKASCLHVFESGAGDNSGFINFESGELSQIQAIGYDDEQYEFLDFRAGKLELQSFGEGGMPHDDADLPEPFFDELMAWTEKYCCDPESFNMYFYSSATEVYKM